MLTEQEKNALLRERDQAFDALDHGDERTFQEIYTTTIERLRRRLDDLQAQALRDRDATGYDDATRFATNLRHAFHQRHQAVFKKPTAPPVQVQPFRSALVYPLPVLLEAIAQGQVASVEVCDMGTDTVTGEEMLSVFLGLRPEAEQLLIEGARHRGNIPLGLGLRRSLPDQSMDELTRRLSHDSEMPTRAEIAVLLQAVETYNATHTPLIRSTN